MGKKHKIRDKHGNFVEVELTPKRAIKHFCYECMGFQKAEVRNCTAPNCPLYIFRPLKFDSEKAEQPSSLRQG